MSNDTDFNEVNSRLEKLGVSSGRPSTFDGTHSPPISTSHGQLSSDIQARIMAFQQKRQSTPAAPPRQDSAPQKPLPPLPTNIMRSASLGDTSPLMASPVSMETLKHSPSAAVPQRAVGKNELSQRSSLSQRRGMKLNMSGLGSPSAGPELHVNTTGELARRLSERKSRPDFKLNLNSTPTSNTPAAVASGSSSLGEKSEEAPAQLQGLFANYSKYVDIKSGSLNFTGKASLHSKGINFSSGTSFHISLDDIQFIEELGRGNYGTVSKVLHKPTGVLMAMKEVRLELEENKFAQILMELEVLHKCNSPYIVDFYGAFFVEGAVYMCMEYMDGGSLDKVYGEGILDEACLAYIADSVIRGLQVLKDTHNIIHRDVKPTNILVNSQGKVKLCDFGVSGNLVASLAKTNIGCQSYMAPERIKTLKPDDTTYSVQSDIWSLGLTILEVAAGRYPYPPETFDNIFLQLSAIVDGEPPKLDEKLYSKDAQLFVKSCLRKNPDARPPYDVLLQSPWLTKHAGEVPPLMSVIVKKSIEADKPVTPTAPKVAKAPVVNPKDSLAGSLGIENVQSLLKNKINAPALHRGGLTSQRIPR